MIRNGFYVTYMAALQYYTRVHVTESDVLDTWVFVIDQIMFGWKTYEYDCETDELPNPRPIQPKKN